MHYAVALVVLKHASKPHQKVRITQPTKEATPQVQLLRTHIEYILGMQGDALATPFDVVDLTIKEI